MVILQESKNFIRFHCKIFSVYMRECASERIMLNLFFNPHQSIHPSTHPCVYECIWKFFRWCQSKTGQVQWKLINNIKRLKIYLPENKCEYKKNNNNKCKGKKEKHNTIEWMATITMKQHRETTEESISFSLKWKKIKLRFDHIYSMGCRFTYTLLYSILLSTSIQTKCNRQHTDTDTQNYSLNINTHRNVFILIECFKPFYIVWLLSTKFLNLCSIFGGSCETFGPSQWARKTFNSV